MSVESWSRSLRAIRGGYWDNEPRDARVAIRSYGTPDSRDFDLGFRLMRRMS
jgi:formylglycine-generating enzyme required for sulfatase activity